MFKKYDAQAFICCGFVNMPITQFKHSAYYFVIIDNAEAT